MVLRGWKPDFVKDCCIPLYFNGYNHYDLIDEVWLHSQGVAKAGIKLRLADRAAGQPSRRECHSISLEQALFWPGYRGGLHIFSVRGPGAAPGPGPGPGPRAPGPGPRGGLKGPFKGLAQTSLGLAKLG